MPRLLILCEYPTLLGGERSMLATLGAVAAAGFETLVAAPPRGPLADSLRQRGVSHVSWPTHDNAGSRFSLDELRGALGSLLGMVRPQLLHANSLSTARIAGPVAAARGLAGIGHLRDIVKLSPQAIADLNANCRLIAVSRSTRDFHVAQGIDAPRCATIYNGVDLSQFRPQPSTGLMHRELRLPPCTRLVAMIGQLGQRKGMDVALGAAWQISADLPELHWLVIGERTSHKPEALDFEARLHGMAAEAPLAGRVHFLGPREDVADILPECELLVHAARQEPLGRVLLEAAACGLAVVATDVGGTREIFPSESDGALVVRPDDGSALASAVASLLRDDSRRRELGRAARRRAEMAFDIRDAAARLIEEYQRALSR